MNSLNDFLQKGKDNGVAQNITISLKESGENHIVGDQNLAFDLASLSKVFSAILTLKLNELERLSIEDFISKYLNTKSNIKIKDLLMHTSTLKDNDFNFNKDIISQIQNNPNKKDDINYADINYIILYELISQIDDFEKLMNKYIFDKEEIYFNPPNKGICAPTEKRVNRGQVQGVVHDQKCFNMNGVSAHAGLFSNIENISLFFNRFINGNIIDLKILSDQKYIKQTGQTKRNLVFEIRNPKEQMGKYENKAWFHTGFTGTSVLIDINKNSYLILLTNRIYPSRNNEKIFEYRKEASNILYRRNYE